MTGANLENLLKSSAAAESTLLNPQVIEQLFDHVPETAFFLKDTSGRYLAVNQSLVLRCGLREKNQLISRSVQDIFPAELAKRYSAQDDQVLRSGKSVIDQLELHWYAHRKPGWCLTTKLALRDGSVKIIGLAGISRDLRAPGDRETIPEGLMRTLDYLEDRYGEEISPAQLAKLAGLPLVRFGRLIKRIFGLTPGQLITQTRLAAASDLLRETETSVAEIAHACGFYDHSAFTRVFRSATGVTPTQFRREWRAKRSNE